MAKVLRGSVLLPLSIERAWGPVDDASRFPQWRSVFSSAQPGFVGMTTVDHDELEGYRIWLADRGPTLTALTPFLRGDGDRQFAPPEPA